MKAYLQRFDLIHTCQGKFNGKCILSAGPKMCHAESEPIVTVRIRAHITHKFYYFLQYFVLHTYTSWSSYMIEFLNKSWYMIYYAFNMFNIVYLFNKSNLHKRFLGKHYLLLSFCTLSKASIRNVTT